MGGRSARRANCTKRLETLSGCQGGPVRPGEDETGVDPGAAEQASLALLLASHGAQHLQGDVVERYGSLAVGGLGLAELGLVGDGDHGLADGEQAGVEVDG